MHMYIFKVCRVCFVSERERFVFCRVKSIGLSECRGVWLVMTRRRSRRQAAARLRYREACPVFVTGAAGNGMQISLLSVGTII